MGLLALCCLLLVQFTGCIGLPRPERAWSQEDFFIYNEDGTLYYNIVEDNEPIKQYGSGGFMTFRGVMRGDDALFALQKYDLSPENSVRRVIGSSSIVLSPYEDLAAEVERTRYSIDIVAFLVIVDGDVFTPMDVEEALRVSETMTATEPYDKDCYFLLFTVNRAMIESYTVYYRKAGEAEIHGQFPGR